VDKKPWLTLSTEVTPKAAPTRVKGAKYFNKSEFTFPERANLKELVKEAAVEANLLVPRVM
jgi:hypothetical protein